MSIHLYHSNSDSHSNGINEMSPFSSSYKSSKRVELKRKIVENHLSYLSHDDNLEKLSHKTKLESLIIEYLSIVHHSEKFEIIEIAECLDRSIIENNDFSASKAATAFEILEKYANNLLTKPWRKEFQTIYPYGGYIKGLIEKQLRGAFSILYLMGYRNRTINGVTTLYNGSRVNDPDILALISLECLIAFVECQMMFQISEALKRKGIEISWIQMLEIKSNHICSMPELVNFVVESNNSKNLIDFEKSLNSNLVHESLPFKCKRGHIYNGCTLHDSYSPSFPKKKEKPYSEETFAQSRPDGHLSFDLMHFPDPMAYYHHPHSPNIPFIAPPPMFATNHIPIQTPLPPLNSTAFSNHPIQSSHTHKVPFPTSSSSSSTSSSSSYQVVDKRFDQANCNPNKSQVDMVDANLSLLSLKSHSPKIKTQNGSSDRSNELLIKKEDHRSLYSKPNTNSFSTNELSVLKSSNIGHSNRKSLNNMGEKNTLQNDGKKSGKSSAATAITDILTNNVTSTFSCSQKPGLVSNEKNNKEDDNQSWPCSYCTFLNESTSDICEMCSRSKEKPGSDITSLISGGKVCPLCTLVNSKEANNCKACESSLLNSPTYI